MPGKVTVHNLFGDSTDILKQNGQIQYLLDPALRKAGRFKKKKEA